GRPSLYPVGGYVGPDRGLGAVLPELVPGHRRRRLSGGRSVGEPAATSVVDGGAGPVLYRDHAVAGRGGVGVPAHRASRRDPARGGGAGGGARHRVLRLRGRAVDVVS